MTYLLRLVACLFVLLSFNAKALVVDGCAIQPYSQCSGGNQDWYDFRHVDLSGLDISYANLSFNDFYNADLTFSNLFNINLHSANMSEVSISNANLGSSNLSYTNLSQANLSWSDLTYSNLYHTALPYANLTGADLSFTTGIETVDFFQSVYSESTIFPAGFNPLAANMIFVSEVPLPAGIYLFLSGLVGLGLMRGRNA